MASEEGIGIEEEVAELPVTIPPRLAVLGARFIRAASRDKRPIDKDWPNTLMDATAPRMVDHLARNGNYGVGCGHPVNDREGRLGVLDIDRPDVAHSIMARLPKTLTVKTGGGGFHPYFVLTGWDGKKAVLGRGDNHLGELQGLGTQVIGPGSIHPNGNRYEIVRDCEMSDVSFEVIMAAVAPYLPPPEDVLRAAREERHEGGAEVDDIDITAVIPMGGLKQQGRGWQGPHPIHDSAGGMNFTVDVEQGAWHCFRHGSGGGPMLYLAMEAGILSCDECRPGALRGESFKKARTIAVDRGLVTPMRTGTNELGEVETVNSRGKATTKVVPGLVAYTIMKRKTYKCVRGQDLILVWDVGVYVRGEEHLREDIQRLLGDDATTHIVKEVRGHIERQTYVDLEDFDPVPRWGEPITINVRNGLLTIDLETGGLTLRDHTHDYLSRVQLPVDYIPHPPLDDIEFVDAFLDSLVIKEDRPLLPEFYGYCLLPGYPFKKAIILMGDRDNGKTTYLNALKSILGERNVSGISLQALSNNRFAPAQLHGKLANICDDMAAGTIAHTHAFKAATGDSLIDGEIKKVQDHIYFHSRAKLAFACNLLAPVMDQAGAFYSRTILINFSNIFPRNQVFSDRLASDGCKSALLNRAIEGAIRLFRNDGFSRSEDPEEVRARWKSLSDPIGRFTDENIVVEKGAEELKSDVRAEYEKFIREKNWPLQGWNFVAGEIVARCGGEAIIQTGQRRVGKAKPRIFIGLRLASKDPEKGVPDRHRSLENYPNDDTGGEADGSAPDESPENKDTEGAGSEVEPVSPTTIPLPYAYTQEPIDSTRAPTSQIGTRAHTHGSEQVIGDTPSGVIGDSSVTPSDEEKRLLKEAILTIIGEKAYLTSEIPFRLRELGIESELFMIKAIIAEEKEAGKIRIGDRSGWEMVNANDGGDAEP